LNQQQQQQQQQHIIKQSNSHAVMQCINAMYTRQKTAMSEAMTMLLIDPPLGYID